MMCQLEIVFSPARADLDCIGSRPDPGGFVYRVRNREGTVRLGGSSRGLDPLLALARAKAQAKLLGFTHWRTWNAGGPYVLIEG